MVTYCFEEHDGWLGLILRTIGDFEDTDYARCSRPRKMYWTQVR